MAQKPQQYNIGDRVMVVGTISGTPDAGTIVNNLSTYSVKVDGTEQDYHYGFPLAALSPEKDSTKNDNVLPYFVEKEPSPSFPFSDKISEINIKYK